VPAINPLSMVGYVASSSWGAPGTARLSPTHTKLRQHRLRQRTMIGAGELPVAADEVLITVVDHADGADANAPVVSKKWRMEGAGRITAAPHQTGATLTQYVYFILLHLRVCFMKLNK
jgi:hypothetical protein